MTEELLQEMGCTVAAIALNGDGMPSRRWANSQIDVALLDVNLGGTSSLALAPGMRETRYLRDFRHRIFGA